MARIEVKGLSKRFGEHSVIPGVDLSIADGEFMVLVGPSGCGKSTLLRMLAGLEEVSSGEILFDGRAVTHVAPADRGVAMVFQSYALYPHMTVAQNMAFALRMAGVGQAERSARVLQAAQKLQLQDLLERYPKELSGGQRQRVAIGRAIVRQPKVFLFDEPLSNLDAALRVHMRIELARLHADLSTTMVYVTHDQTEAMTLGHRIAVFNQGRIEQVGAPMDLYRTPVNRFVAEFLGTPKINLLPYVRGSEPASIQVGAQLLALPAVPSALLDRLARGACLGVRPEFLRLDSASPGIAGVIDFIENLGDVRIAYVRCQGLQELVRVKLAHQEGQFAAGQAVRCCPDFDQLHIFDPQGQAL